MLLAAVALVWLRLYVSGFTVRQDGRTGLTTHDRIGEPH